MERFNAIDVISILNTLLVIGVTANFKLLWNIDRRLVKLETLFEAKKKD